MNQVNLAGVTLICIDTVNPDLALRAMQRSQSQCQFDRSILFTDKPIQVDGIEIVQVSNINSIESYSQFVVQGLAPYISTSHLLLVQWDGFIIHPEAWREEFLEYDYIGAPWPNHPEPYNVGNGGFSLRSRKLLDALSQVTFSEFHPEDEHICRTHRSELEKLGIKFAPTTMAEQFSYEFTQPTSSTFGFHGLSNFPDFMSEPELLAYLENLPTGIIFNNYFLEFCRKLIAPGMCSTNCYNALEMLASMEINHASSEKLQSLQSKQLLSGLCKLGLKKVARELGKRRFKAVPSMQNFRLLIKPYL